MKVQLFLFVMWIKSVTSYSSGKVEDACQDMMPGHHNQPSPTSPPYTVVVDKSIFSPGDQIKVTLSAASSTSSVYFEGFLIEARDTANLEGGAVGTFTLLDSSISRLLSCHQKKDSAVSHTSGHSKTEVQVIWTAPQAPPARVQFLVTVVQKFQLFWVKIPSPVLSLNGAPPPASLSPQTTTAPTPLPHPFTSEGCGITKTCLRDPEGCSPKNDTHCYFLSFRKVEQRVKFELSGPATGYVSFALSTDKWMGNDDVYLCVRHPDRVSISAAYVEGRTHPVIASENVLRETAWRLADGVIQCSFLRNVRIPALNQDRFDLDQMYYLFMAHGRAEKGRIHRHDRQPLISAKQVVITGPPEDLSGSRAPLLIKFHAAFMLIGWMTTVSTGVIIARYFKPDWPEITVCGQRVWFQFHRGLMLLTVLLTCIGFMLPFIYRRGWSKRAGSHPYFGCTIMALAVIQPIMALFRPAPDSSRRYIFNWAHLGTGITAQLLAVIAIFLGIHQQALLLPASWTTGLLAACVVWFVLADFALEAHRRGLFPIGQFFRNFQIYTENLQTEDKEGILFVQTEDDCKGGSFKKIVLAVYLCGNLGFLAALLVTISEV
ncbi:putative ferric-chelate reductase 1 [Neoarius graeffei]|uniref:putative ferric-chelate reductase 1 n=1 Tax=Neoarius graeffei TaxID=443677 RepID=UPI00298CA92D|nr:putative ferric-chelate reductase 1 [Neoarius graeffei]XP_060778026.1 putative ferric-chelate reductase 1 [Neoarius graeffei]XP_060778027.1 putative ferric-chelate reductase 1 [Neoarius graeffei]